MIDYERAELDAERLLLSLRGDDPARGEQRHRALHLACFIAVIEFLVIVVGVAFAF